MGDPQTSFFDAITQFLMKSLGMIISVCMATIAKIAFESYNRKLSWREIIIMVTISVFAGYMAALYCDYKGWSEASKWVVPLATLLGQSLINHIMRNGHKWIKNFFNGKNGNS